MRNAVIACCILAGLTTIVFAQVARFEFVNYDDDAHVYENPGALRGLGPESVAWVFQTTFVGNYIPITGLSFLLDYQIYGLDPGGYHLTNLLFHIANVLLLFVFLNTTTRRIWPSVFAAALFAVHPLHVESVAWISARKDVVSTFFWLAAMLSYAIYARRPRVFPYVLSFALFLLGLFSKPMLVTLPFVLLLLDLWPLQRFDPMSLASKEERAKLRKLILEKVPFLAAAIAISTLTAVTQYRTGAVAAATAVPLFHRIQNALVSYAAYLGKTIWPNDLIVHYPYRSAAFSPVPIVGAIVFLLVVTTALLYMTRRRPYLIVGWLWYLGTLVPVIGLVQVGNQSMADRYTYVPLIGVFIAVAWAVADIVQRVPRLKIALPAVCTAIVLLLAGAAYRQTGYWRDSATLFAHVIDIDPGNALGQNKIGSALLETGKVDEAIVHIEAALRLNPEDPTALINLGAARLMQERPGQAVGPLRHALEIDPEDEVTQLNLAIALYELGAPEAAREHAREALRINPDYEKARGFLDVLGQGPGAH